MILTDSNFNNYRSGNRFEYHGVFTKCFLLELLHHIAGNGMWYWI
jgi:hypothetical protein